MKAASLLSAAALSFALAGVAAAQTAPAASATRATPATPAQPAPGKGTAATPATPATPASASASPGLAGGDLVATAKAAGQFNTLLKAAELTNLTPVLKGAGPLTVFAPTDAAFAALPPGELDRLMKSPAELQKLLMGHVVNTKVAGDQVDGKIAKVANIGGSELSIDGSGETLTVNGAAVVKPDVMASNGVIHVVDRIILPGGAGATASAAAPTASGTNASTTEQPANASK